MSYTNGGQRDECLDVWAVLKVYIFTNKHNQVNFKISREMVKRIGLVLVFFAPLIRYVYLHVSERKGS